MSEGSSLNTCIFSVTNFTVFLHLGILDSTSALHTGAILNSKITTKKNKEI